MGSMSCLDASSLAAIAGVASLASRALSPPNRPANTQSRVEIHPPTGAIMDGDMHARCGGTWAVAGRHRYGHGSSPRPTI